MSFVMCSITRVKKRCCMSRLDHNCWTCLCMIIVTEMVATSNVDFQLFFRFLPTIRWPNWRTSYTQSRLSVWTVYCPGILIIQSRYLRLGMQLIDRHTKVLVCICSHEILPIQSHIVSLQLPEQPIFSSDEHEKAMGCDLATWAHEASVCPY